MADNFDNAYDPFGEVFDDDAVINRGDVAEIESKKKGDKGEVIKTEDFERRRDPEFPSDKFSQEDLDQIISYDDERRKKMIFEDKIDEKIELNEEDPDLKNNFKDYIVAPRISGRSDFSFKSNKFPSGKLKDSGQKVEITDDPHLFKDDHDKATIMINRDEKGDVDNIEIVCSCGERILMKFDFADVFDDVLTQQTIANINEPKPFDSEDINSSSDMMMYPELLEDDFDDSESPKSKQKETESKAPKQSSDEEQFGLPEFDDGDELDMGDIDLSGI